jgi:Pyrimidine dimer DNA glycosylase
MRSWHPISPRKLDRQRLLGEHVELHVLFRVITCGEPGWKHHPERKRWEHHVPALKLRHDAIAEEMLYRGYAHRSPLPDVEGAVTWPPPWQPVGVMKQVLKEKQRGEVR